MSQASAIYPEQRNPLWRQWAKRLREVLDRQGESRLAEQPQILNGLKDFRRVERLARRKDVRGLKKFIRQRATEAAKTQLTYWKKFYKLQRPGQGRPPDPETETAASMRTDGLSYSQIAKRIDPRGYERDPRATIERVRNNVKNFYRRFPYLHS